MITYRDGTILRGSSPEIYVIEAGHRRQITNPIIFIAKGYDWNKMNFISDQDLETIPLGPSLSLDEVIYSWTEADRLLESRRMLLEIKDPCVPSKV